MMPAAPVLDRPGARFANHLTYASGLFDPKGGAAPVTHQQYAEWRTVQEMRRRAFTVRNDHAWDVAQAEERRLRHAIGIDLKKYDHDALSMDAIAHKFRHSRDLSYLGMPPVMAGGARASNIDVLAGSVGSATAISASATETVLFPSYLLTAGGNTASNSPNYYQGKMIELKFFGVYTSAASTPGTGLSKIHMGTANTNADAGVVASSTTTIITSGANDPFNGYATLTMNAIGASGNTIIGAGQHFMANHTVGTYGLIYFLNGTNGQSAPAAVTVNTTVNNYIGWYWTFSSSTTNTCQVFQWYYSELDI